MTDPARNATRPFVERYKAKNPAAVERELLSEHLAAAVRRYLDIETTRRLTNPNVRAIPACADDLASSVLDYAFLDGRGKPSTKRAMESYFEIENALRNGDLEEAKRLHDNLPEVDKVAAKMMLLGPSMEEVGPAIDLPMDNPELAVLAASIVAHKLRGMARSNTRLHPLGGRPKGGNAPTRFLARDLADIYRKITRTQPKRAPRAIQAKAPRTVRSEDPYGQWPRFVKMVADAAAEFGIELPVKNLVKLGADPASAKRRRS